MKNREEIAMDLVYIPIVVIGTPFLLAAQAKEKMVRTADNIRCEMKNRRHFDKKFPNLAPKK